MWAFGLNDPCLIIEQIFQLYNGNHIHRKPNTTGEKINKTKELKKAKIESKLPENVRIVIEIAKQVDALKLTLPRELVFKAAVLALYGIELH
jgi:hypothetical protein